MSENFLSMDRRSFLKGAIATGAAATAAAAGATTLAGCAAEPKGTADGKMASTGTYAFETAPDPIPESDIVETVDADIVIIGAGFSGLCCALAAAENGAKVVMLERMDHVVGRGGSIYAMNSKLTKEKGYECPVEEIAQRYKRMMGYHSYRVDGRKWMNHFHRSGEAMDWLIDRMTTASAVGGNDLTPVMEHWYEDPEDINGEFPGTHEFLDGPNGLGPDDNPQQDVCDNMAAYCAQAGVDIRYLTDAQQLLKDGERVTGVVAKTADGYAQFNGKNAVVLATGDFGMDKDMLEKYIPWAAHQTEFGGIWDGSGHKMAYWAGAAVDKNETPTPMIFCFQWRSITRQVRAFQGLMVNAEGRRYTNEDNVISHGALALTHEIGHHAFAIWDDDYANEPQWQNHRYVDGPKVFETPDDVRAYWQTTIDGPGTINMNGSGDIEVKMVKADTLEELVEALELPAETTLKTIEDYNGFCETGVDEEFGKRKELLLPVKKGPFYGIKCTPWFLTTVGGIRCTENMEVMNESNEIIDGLYCLGSMVGDMYCNCYSTHFPGHNLGGTCLTFGYLTGRRLAGAE
ncbi:FAD-dependent oxidoreductase [Adlercreutzia sp. R21]|uniref:FAD-dependent oxidoreductase n=1 Tax=Adlercreutzia wanghongyangiae TaxID=3111451 RepID=UPI002DB9A679|nr:FAD-dependent oxidoreductase [Adlercreutzia sp. R21]MEC4183940.1 FAD-dependent oxidoreductase [Adlercreutzia sp. R21]